MVLVVTDYPTFVVRHRRWSFQSFSAAPSACPLRHKAITMLLSDLELPDGLVDCTLLVRRMDVA